MFDSDCQLYISTAVRSLKSGKIIAYPTESVFGLGCDPFNSDAVSDLLILKHRELNKGFILIAESWDQVSDLVQPIPPAQFVRVMDTWPGPVTWLFPSTNRVPQWTSGSHKSVAIRITNHPVAKELCRQFGGPIISTSANICGHAPATTIESLRCIFSDKIATYVPGETGKRNKPTPIFDAMTGQSIREG